MDTDHKYIRYHRQIILKEFGRPAQDKLSSAKVLVIGAGGLGCPALQYLTAAGIGKIGIVDFDKVEISNLHRQVLFNMDDIGKSKAEAASEKLRMMNQDIKFIVHKIEITNQNSFELISEYDIVIDGTDNFSTRYTVNDASVLLDKPLVYGAVQKYEGQVGVFNLLDENTKLKLNYRDLFPKPPDASSVLSCNEAGVLGVLPGIIGTMQATETIKIITGIGKPLLNKIISYNALENTFNEFNLSSNENSEKLFPKDEEAFRDFNYDYFCNRMSNLEISIEEFESKRFSEKFTVIDVREADELPEVNDFAFTRITLNEFEKKINNISTERKIVIYCQTGIRSLKAVKILKEKYPEAEAYSLKGGIEMWKRFNKNYDSNYE